MNTETATERKSYKKYQLNHAWQAVAAGELYAVVQNHSFYIEDPEEAREGEDDDRECVLRVFLTHDDAAEYMEQIRDTRNVPEKELSVIHTDLEDLFGTVTFLNMYGSMAYEAPLRVDLCVITPGEWPKAIDTLWTTKGWKH